jgi:quercetin dioxygenase-like cupin family protein
MVETRGHIYTKQHQLSGEALFFDFNEQASQVLAEARESNVHRAGRTLVKEGALRLTLVAFAAGGSLSDHKAGGPVSIEVLTGAVEIKVGDRTERLTEKQALVLNTDVMHSVVAADEAVILLTIGMAP